MKHFEQHTTKVVPDWGRKMPEADDKPMKPPRLPKANRQYRFSGASLNTYLEQYEEAYEEA